MAIYYERFYDCESPARPDQFLDLCFQPSETFLGENNIHNYPLIMRAPSNSNKICHEHRTIYQNTLITTNGSFPTNTRPINIDYASNRYVGHGESFVCIEIGWDSCYDILVL